MHRMIHNDFDNGRENMIFITITRWKLQSAGSLGLRTHQEEFSFGVRTNLVHILMVPMFTVDGSA